MKKFMVLVVLASAAGAGWSAPASDDGDEFTVPVKQEEKVEKTKPEIGDGTKPKKKVRKCFNCRGKGIVVINTKDICDRCDGKGVLESEVILRNKHWANGDWYGNVRTKKSVNRQPCPRCNRSGKMNVKKEIECSKCNGKGEL